MISHERALAHSSLPMSISRPEPGTWLPPVHVATGARRVMRPTAACGIGTEQTDDGVRAVIRASVNNPTLDMFTRRTPRQSTARGAPFRITSVRPDAT
jgi:hypothetical protein